MFDDAQKTLAVTFARALAARNYAQAYDMLSAAAQSRISVEALRETFESMIPPDWGEVNPIELQESPYTAGRLLYVVLGGPVYSEAVIVHGFTTEDGTPKIDNFELGRP
jgi:hypothetical protein